MSVLMGFVGLVLFYFILFLFCKIMAKNGAEACRTGEESEGNPYAISKSGEVDYGDEG